MEGGGTLQEWGGRRAVMDALPAMDCYEDMFKEITRKLYGEDGLPDMSEGDHPGMRAPPDYDGESPEGGHGALAAFGLAALMQNGFPPPPGMFGHHHHLQSESSKFRQVGEDKWVSSDETLQWTSSKIATYNAAQKLFRCTECECVGFLSRVAEHWLGTHANLRVFQCPQCPYASAWARCVRMHLQRQHNVVDTGENATALLKENPVLEEVTKYLQRLKGKVESPSGQSIVTTSSTQSNLKTEFVTPSQNHNQTQNSTPSRTTSQPGGTENAHSKRYCCTFCPYATDRRDLFTRHENIHRDEKPFQCYVCQKQFNRADHVKKHFLRMHRDHPYDLNRIRRQPPKNSNGMAYYQKYSSPQQNPPRPQSLPTQGQIHHGLNIPAGFPPPPAAIRGVKQPLPSPPKMQQNGCNAKSHGSKTAKKKGEKRYTCCYCAWSGVDNWCLKRHLNTHLKPFVCGLCDYKAARSERLATHVLKVHNKRACGRCSFLGEDSAQLAIHMQEHHPLEHRNNRSSNNVLRSTNFANNHTTSALPTPFCHDSITSSSAPAVRRHYEEASTPGLWNPHGHVPNSYPLQDDAWKSSNKHFGAARLFHYMEASDNSEPENEPEEEEPPPFICRECGCEFVDDTSLETHVFMHHRSTGPRAIKQEPIRSLTYKYNKYCSTPREESPLSKRPRKQQTPKKVVSTAEIRVVRRPPKRRRKKQPADYISRLRDKHISYLIMRKGLRCFWCRSWSEVFPYHTVSSLALHKLWHHRKDKFGCEHCPVRYRHRYRVVLHSSRAHLPRPHREQIPIQTDHGLMLNSEPKVTGPHIVLSVSDQDNPVQNNVPVLIARTEILSPGNQLQETAIKGTHMIARVTEAVTLPADLGEVSMKIPNFLSSLHELQPSFKSNHFVFRASDMFSTSKSIQELPPTHKTSAVIPVQELKSYQIFNKIEIKGDDDGPIVIKNALPMQDLETQVKTIRPGDIEELRAVPEGHVNNNTIAQLEMTEKGSRVIETQHIEELIDPSSIQGGSGPMSLVIPSYPPSG